MNHVVHINNGSDAAKPIILRLLPGEETIFDLKVVNHGQPSDISLEASNSVFRAVRFRKQDNYVDREETIPIMARMPANKNRLDGDILLTSNAGESRIPISLLRDSEDQGIDLNSPGLRGGKDLSNDLSKESSDQEDSDQDRDEYQREYTGDEGDDDGDADSDAVDGPFRRTKRIGEDSEDDEDAEEGDDFDSLDRTRKSDDDEEEKEKEPRRIVFSRDRDLQRYRSASRQKSDDNPDEGGAAGGRERRKRGIGREISGVSEGRIDEDLEDSVDKRPDSQVYPRFSNRIDDRFVDRSFRQDAAPGPDSDEGRPEESTHRQRLPHDLSEDYQDYQPEPDIENGEGIGGRGVRDIFSPPEANPATVVEDGGYLDQGGQDFDQGNFGPFGLTQIIPMVIFMALLVVLVLTFITYSIPEFPGAVGSSILIVTLIIYGAATLLKA